jgi:hypothetical protein
MKMDKGAALGGKCDSFGLLTAVGVVGGGAVDHLLGLGIAGPLNPQGFTPLKSLLQGNLGVPGAGMDQPQPTQHQGSDRLETECSHGWPIHGHRPHNRNQNRFSQTLGRAITSIPHGQQVQPAGRGKERQMKNLDKMGDINI